MLLTILAIWFGYKKAKATGRNPILWAFICGVTFIGTQLLTAVLIGITIGIGIELRGWPENLYEKYEILITIASIAVSIVSLLLLFRYLDRVPEEKGPVEEPPPPPIFGDGN